VARELAPAGRASVPCDVTLEHGGRFAPQREQAPSPQEPGRLKNLHQPWVPTSALSTYISLKHLNQKPVCLSSTYIKRLFACKHLHQSVAATGLGAIW